MAEKNKETRDANVGRFINLTVTLDCNVQRLTVITVQLHNLTHANLNTAQRPNLKQSQIEPLKSIIADKGNSCVSESQNQSASCVI